jgi:hypothetical protein
MLTTIFIHIFLTPMGISNLSHNMYKSSPQFFRFIALSSIRQVATPNPIKNVWTSSIFITLMFAIKLAQQTQRNVTSSCEAALFDSIIIKPQ